MKTCTSVQWAAMNNNLRHMLACSRRADYLAMTVACHPDSSPEQRDGAIACCVRNRAVLRSAYDSIRAVKVEGWHSRAMLREVSDYLAGV